jgi:hypothetical protein
MQGGSDPYILLCHYYDGSRFPEMQDEQKHRVYCSLNMEIV